MKMLEIEKRENGAHRNQTFNGVLPDGWAVIPDDMELSNFPFGDAKAELLPFGEPDPETGEIPQVMTMTEWAPGEILEPEAPHPPQQREEAYNTQPIIEWDGEMLTVTQAAQMWQYYAAEGSWKAETLQSLIADAKGKIRSEFPNKAV